MAESEFDLIRHHILSHAGKRADVNLGIGDDCALLTVPDGHELAVSIDTLVAGVHFFVDTDPAVLGYRALAVSLSDLAAMGATPAWVTLALTMPQADADWLAAFMSGFHQLLEAYGLQLVGGDLTQGPLTISVQVHGFVAQGKALRRSGAKPGDVLLVTGTLGDAALAVQMTKNHATQHHDFSALRAALDYPQPRLNFGKAVAHLASAAIDLSDGLAGDLAHLCEQSGVAALVTTDALPLSDAFLRHADWILAVTGGDDYELCLTVSPAHLKEVMALAQAQAMRLTRIGEMTAGEGVHFILPDGRRIDKLQAYQHFSADTACYST